MGTKKKKKNSPLIFFQHLFKIKDNKFTKNKKKSTYHIPHTNKLYQHKK